jgi:acyl-CoA synthetase (AMP-forming)/AMP-acid ligase II
MIVAVGTFNLADLFELVVDAASDREAVVTPERRLTFVQLDERANRFANHLLAAGIGVGDHVGLQLLNGTEYLEAMLGCFKARAVPINVNYRYVERELTYLFDDADLVALVYHRQFAPRVTAASSDLDALRHFVVVEDGSDADAVPGSVGYEAALAAATPARPALGERTGDDIYIAYTGGTTGLPKGVVWRHEDVFFAAIGGGAPMAPEYAITRPDELAERVPEVGLIALQTPPLMHVSAQWGALITLFGGGTVVFPPASHFDPDAIWRLVAIERVNTITIVGDATARPLTDALAAAAAAGDPYDVSSLFIVGSGGAILSPAIKARLTEILPNVIVVDGLGSSETGVVGAGMSTAADPVGGPRFRVDDYTTVLDDDSRPVEPGSGVVGQLARRGHLPLGYYKDEAKSKATFVVVAGVRWALPGDMATVDADGTVVFLGRGSISINTGGEKVYPEEVEAVLKGHPDVNDAVVVGAPDEQWGESVVAIVQPRKGLTPQLRDIQELCRKQLAHYKVPRSLHLVDEIERSPSGKPDYRWARDIADAAVSHRP